MSDGGAVHLAFLNPSQLTRQYSMMPDGTTYFCFAKVQLQPIGGSIVHGTAYSIGLGTNVRRLWAEGLGRLALVYVVSLFGFVIWIGLAVSWLFFHGVPTGGS